MLISKIFIPESEHGNEIAFLEDTLDDENQDEGKLIPKQNMEPSCKLSYYTYAQKYYIMGMEFKIWKWQLVHIMVYNTMPCHCVIIFLICSNFRL